VPLERIEKGMEFFMFKVKKKTIKNELTYKGNVIVKYEIEYPEICSNCYNTKYFNDLNLKKALELEKYAKETLFSDSKIQYEYSLANGYPIMVYELVFHYTVTYNRAPIISLYQDQYVFTGGAHGSTIRTSQNWDLTCNNQITLDKIYKNNPNYILYILKEINKQIEEKGIDLFFDNYCTLVIETFKPNQFYINPNTITIYFQQYDIAPYSTGIPTFEISYK